MNKKFIKVAFVAAIALVGGVNVFNAQKANALSDVVLANVEALALNEDIDGGTLPGVTITCGAISGPCWKQDGLCMKGEYMGFHCVRTDDSRFSCTPC